MINAPFLATTALQDFWDKEKDEILFLGSWCMLYDKQNDWNKLNYELMDSPLKSKDDIIKGMEYCSQTYDVLIERIAKYLNAINGTNYETRYWKLIVGTWFATYLYLVYDHYINVKHVLEKYPNLTTLCLSEDSFVTPLHYENFVSLVESDFYNLQIFSNLFHLLGYEFPKKKAIPPKTNFKINAVGPLQNIKKLILKIEAWLQKRMALRVPILLWNIYFPRTLAYRLLNSTRLRATPLNLKDNFITCHEVPLKNEARNGFAGIQADDAFQKILLQSLSVHFPVLYLEGYQKAVEKIRKEWKQYPKVLMSANGWFGNEYMKFLAAETIHHGGKLLGYQHGGGYGTNDVFLAEKLETDLSDRYYTWGWGDESKSNKIYNLPNPKLSVLRSRKIKSKNSSHILYVSTAMRRYGMRSVGSDTSVFFYLQNQLDFFDSIPKEIHRHFFLRLFPKEYGLSQDKRLLSVYPSLKMDNFRKPFLKRLESVRLVVFDHLSTTFLEAINCDIPIIVFNGGKYNFFRKEALPYINMLKEADIYFDNAIDAAVQVRKIFNAPEIWWQSEQVQSARVTFMDRYALGSNDWLKQWRKELLNWL